VVVSIGAQRPGGRRWRGRQWSDAPRWIGAVARSSAAVATGVAGPVVAHSRKRRGNTCGTRFSCSDKRTTAPGWIPSVGLIWRQPWGASIMRWTCWSSVAP